jgi:hypothetical protein
MPRIEVLFALGLVALGVYGSIVAITSRQKRGQHPTVPDARWETAHFAADHTTRVVVRKVVPATGVVLDEHLVAVVADDDPSYDAKFLEAMAEARQRVALFESEEP